MGQVSLLCVLSPSSGPLLGVEAHPTSFTPHPRPAEVPLTPCHLALVAAKSSCYPPSSPHKLLLSPDSFARLRGLEYHFCFRALPMRGEFYHKNIFSSFLPTHSFSIRFLAQSLTFIDCCEYTIRFHIHRFKGTWVENTLKRNDSGAQ